VLAHNLALVFPELGGAIAGLGLLVHFVSRWAFSAILLYLYLLSGLAFGNG
jgi:hypothetical protein